MSAVPDGQLTLGQKQRLFCRLQAKLVLWVFAQGWQFSLSDLGNQQGLKHRVGSNHDMRLAADFNLFVNGQYMSQACHEWDVIGAEWKSYDPLCRWGGDFRNEEGKLVGDYNHVSIEHGGRK